jgi:hypothetical protein
VRDWRKVHPRNPKPSTNPTIRLIAISSIAISVQRPRQEPRPVLGQGGVSGTLASPSQAGGLRLGNGRAAPEVSFARASLKRRGAPLPSAEMGNYQFRAIRGLLVVTVIVLGLIVGLLLAFSVAVPVRTYGPWPFAIQNNPRSLAQMTPNMEFSAG